MLLCVCSMLHKRLRWTACGCNATADSLHRSSAPPMSRACHVTSFMCMRGPCSSIAQTSDGGACIRLQRCVACDDAFDSLRAFTIVRQLQAAAALGQVHTRSRFFSNCFWAVVLLLTGWGIAQRMTLACAC